MRRLTKLPPAAARSRKATPARMSRGSGTDAAFEGPSHSIARVMMPLELSSDEPVSPPPDDEPLLLSPPPLLGSLGLYVGGSPPRSWRTDARRARSMSSFALE